MAILTTIRKSARRLLEIWRDNPRIRFDVILTCVVLAVGYVLAVMFDAMDRVVDFMEDHESWELDEILFQVLILAVMLSYFVIRRLTELTHAILAKSTAEREAQNLARHDALTGLPNRRKFFEEMRRRASQSIEPFAVFIVDLDNFKTTNDLYGHRVGDEALIAIARRLTELFPHPNLVARLGGDEFAILIDSASDRQATQRMAHRLTFMLHETLVLSIGSVRIGGSTGIALYPADGATGEELVHCADCAMYQSKDTGGGTYHFFQKDMDAALQERLAIEKDLQVAIEDYEIVPFYQQIVELPSRRAIGYEVLARWIHPIRGLVPPSVFIPVAEDSGKLTALTLSLLRQACADAVAWPEQLFVSINVAPSQLLNPGFFPHFMAIIADMNFSPRRIQIEITESGLIERIPEMKEGLVRFHGQGIKIALDDFGTGYSGLYHLRELKFDVIKIDRSFVTNMLEDNDKARIVEAILNLARTLDIKTTAEGVETERVSTRLARLGCGAAQGYLFGRPSPAADVVIELAGGRATLSEAAG